MRKTPSYLKGLAETFARAAGAVSRHKQQKAELDALLVQMEADLERYRALHAVVCQRLTDAKTDLVSSSRLIRRFDARLDPDEIEPIRATKGRYGFHGGLRQAIVGLLKDASPAALSTDQLARTLEINFDLDFAGQLERRHWTHNSVGNALKKLVADGLVERLHDPSVLGHQDFGRWRWVAGAPMELGALQQAATEAGLQVSRAKRRGRPSSLK